jgi:hypothetical protein
MIEASTNMERLYIRGVLAVSHTTTLSAMALPSLPPKDIDVLLESFPLRLQSPHSAGSPTSGQ